MADPIVHSAVLDKDNYASGDIATLTVVFGDPDAMRIDLSLQARVPASGAVSAPVQVGATVDDTVLDFLELGGKTWTLSSLSAHPLGQLATYTATM